MRSWREQLPSEAAVGEVSDRLRFATLYARYEAKVHLDFVVLRRRTDLPTGSAKEGAGTEMSALLEEMDAMSEEVDRLQQENVTVMARARKSDEEVSLIRDDNSRLRVENSKLSQAAGALSRANTDLKR